MIKKSKTAIFVKKKLFKIEDTDIINMLVSKKELYGKKGSCKYSIGYNDKDVIRPLCIWLPNMIGYANCFKDAKKMSFNASDNKLLEKYSKIWEKLAV